MGVLQDIYNQALAKGKQPNRLSVLRGTTRSSTDPADMLCIYEIQLLSSIWKLLLFTFQEQNWSHWEKETTIYDLKCPG